MRRATHKICDIQPAVRVKTTVTPGAAKRLGTVDIVGAVVDLTVDSVWFCVGYEDRASSPYRLVGNLHDTTGRYLGRTHIDMFTHTMEDEP